MLDVSRTAASRVPAVATDYGPARRTCVKRALRCSRRSFVVSPRSFTLTRICVWPSPVEVRCTQPSPRTRGWSPSGGFTLVKWPHCSEKGGAAPRQPAPRYGKAIGTSAGEYGVHDAQIDPAVLFVVEGHRARPGHRPPGVGEGTTETKRNLARKASPTRPRTVRTSDPLEARGSEGRDSATVLRQRGGPGLKGATTGPGAGKADREPPQARKLFFVREGAAGDGRTAGHSIGKN